MILKYNVRYFDEIEEGSAESKGLVSGADEMACLKEIEAYYGRLNIEKFSFEYFLEESIQNIIPCEEINLEDLEDVFERKTNV